MKKFERKHIVLAGLLITLCGLLVGMFPLQNLIPSDIKVTPSTLANEDTDIYLKLFSEFKDPKQYLGIDSSAFQTGKLVRLRNPFSMPANGPSRTAQRHGTDAKTGPDQAVKSLKLSGILWDDKSPAAIINNKIIHHSEMLSGFKVLKIERDQVILQAQRKTYTLRLPQKKQART